MLIFQNIDEDAIHNDLISSIIDCYFTQSNSSKNAMELCQSVGCEQIVQMIYTKGRHA